jgi:glyoxylase-like metal-dependent hydrolase (beta-lactamase superfamily II)
MARMLTYGEARVLRLGGPMVSAHLLADRDGLTLIDTGLWGIAAELRRVVAKLNRRPDELRAIVLTHGHLDHAAGAAEIQAWSGAGLWLHPADRDHLAQRVRYAGVARICGALEWAGARAGRHRMPRVDEALRDGAVLPFWGGLRVWHLPGHTPGHCALVSERTGLVFAGDLFASYAWSVHEPPGFLCRDVARARESLRVLAAARPADVLPSHYDRMDPGLHARRLAAKWEASPGLRRGD